MEAVTNGVDALDEDAKHCAIAQIGSNVVSDIRMTIAGQSVATSSEFKVVNPANGQVFATAPECTDEQLDDAFEAAETALGRWSSDESARCDAMRAAADAIDAGADEIALILTMEQGKPLKQAKEELFGMSVWLRYYADLDLPVEVIQDDDDAYVDVVRRPLGVVAAITPWNYPLLLASWKIAPALRAGNTMVLKPSPYTPLATLKVGEVLRGVLPDGVFNVVSGGDSLGGRMTAHPAPRKISFTGSVGTGKKVAMAAAADLKRITLELGGNDPAILLDDINPAEVAAKVFKGAFYNNGQICDAIKRVYVPESIYDDVVDALADEARRAKVGDGTLPDTDLGPINNRPQYERVKELVSDALAGGATAVAGGKPMDRDGYFYEPTIIANVSDGVRIVDEEQFGPALPVISYRDIDEVIARANGSHFGLAGSVWGTDVDKAADIASRLECGTAWVNTHLALAPHQPFGGVKWSGLGVENGPWGLHGFTDLKVQYRAKR